MHFVRVHDFSWDAVVESSESHFTVMILDKLKEKNVSDDYAMLKRKFHLKIILMCKGCSKEI